MGPPHTDAAGRYALSSLRRMRGSVASALTAEDLTAFDRLLDTDSPHSILRRIDLGVRTERTVWAARRTCRYDVQTFFSSSAASSILLESGSVSPFRMDLL